MLWRDREVDYCSSRLASDDRHCSGNDGSWRDISDSGSGRRHPSKEVLGIVCVVIELHGIHVSCKDCRRDNGPVHEHNTKRNRKEAGCGSVLMKIKKTKDRF